MEHKQHKFFRIALIPLIVIVVFVLLVANARAITDYIRLFNYEAPAEIAALAEETGMTDEAKKYFYINHPQIADRTTFNEECNSRGEQTIVLGCYHSVDRGIYLFDVTDVRLGGVEHVTAAHEMLHAAYDRLSDKDREYIDAELQKYFDDHVQDERIKNTIAAYERTEPQDLVNEMHSIFATEIPALTPALEEYYKRYFTDRSKVIDFANAYQQEFTSRQEQVKQYDARLRALKDSIDANSAELERREAEIQTLQKRLESDKVAGNTASYNNGVPAYNARVDQYNELIRVTRASIREYNTLVAERNDLALEVRELTQSISSQFEPIGQ